MRRPVVFGKYLLLDRISVGGMAEVFQAKSFGVEGFEKILAIKRILPSMAEDEDFIEMFIDEAKIAGQLSHANICQIFELGKIDSSHFIAMEFVWGKDTLQIQNRFRRLRRRMPLPMAAFIAAKGAEGLDYAHRKRDPQGQPLDIIHRDVSPQNILVSYEGEVKVIDFGIAKAVSRSSKTQAGVLKGKFGYMSPEQVRGLPLDQRSDLFALGTLLWEMVVGERLFTGESDFSILEKVRNADVQPPSSVNPMVPAELERIVMKALAREPDDRYSYGSEMQEDLVGWMMAQSPPFTVKQLSGTLKEMFQRERQREQDSLEEYKRIRREDVDNVSAGQREMAVSQLSLPGGAPKSSRPPPPPSSREQLAPPPSEVVSDAYVISEEFALPDSADDFDDGRTEIGAPAGLADDDDDDDDDAQDISDADLQEVVVPVAAASTDPNEFDDGRTEIYGNAELPAAKPPMAAEPTYIFNAESGQMVHAPDQATVIFTDLVPGNNGSGNGAAGAADVIYDASKPPPVSGTVPVAAPAPRSSVVKDILIGVLLALVLILGIVLWRVFAAAPKPVAVATVVVSATPPRAGSVLIDGKTVGLLVPGKPFTREVAAGKHRVTLKTEAGTRSRVITVAAGKVKVLEPFNIVRPVGKLQLSIVPPDARVFLDNKEVSPASIKGPLQIAANKRHVLRVQKKGFKTAKVEIKLGVGVRSARTIKLEPLILIKVAVTSWPKGATVLVDAKDRGKTPLELELAPGRYRLTLTLERYKTQAQWLEVGEKPPKKPLKVRFRLKRDYSAPARVAGGDRGTGGGGKSTTTVRGGTTGVRRGTGARRKRVTRRRTKKKGPPGYLVANTTPWARVIIDGRDTKRHTPIAPRTKLSLSPGSHKVTFDVKGKRFTFAVKIKSGEITRLIKKLPVQ